MFTLIVLFGTSFLNAQSLVIPDVKVEEGATMVDVPIYVNAPDSASALQFGLVWAPLKLRLDTVKFSLALQDRNFSTVFNQPEDGEVRVLVVPAAGVLDVFSFTEDSAAVVFTFELLSDFKGSAELRFNPNLPAGFSDFYANHISATEQNGSIFSDEVTSIQNIAPSTANINVYPNPVKNNLQITGLPDGYRQSEVYIMDKLGRRLWSSKLTEPAVLLPEALPNGLYWLVINLEEGTCSKPIVILR
jgi:hypothetical protein